MKLKSYFTFLFLSFFSLCLVSCSSTDSKITDADVAISSDYIYDQESTSTSRAFQGAQVDAGQGPVRKFGRGISNVAFGAFELPIQVYETNQTTGGFAALTWGVVKGTGRFVLRELTGVAEILTFFMPLPGCCSTQKYGSGWGYGPIMEPEWIFTFDTDPYNTVYPNRPPN